MELVTETVNTNKFSSIKELNNFFLQLVINNDIYEIKRLIKILRTPSSTLFFFIIYHGA